MATQPKFDDTVRELMASGWTPPPTVAERYRHLLNPFYEAKGLYASPGERLDRTDLENLAAIMAVFRAFDIDVPTAPAE